MMWPGSDAARAMRALRELGGAGGPTAVAEKIGWVTTAPIAMNDVDDGHEVEVSIGPRYDRERAMTALCSLVESGKIESVPADS